MWSPRRRAHRFLSVVSRAGSLSWAARSSAVHSALVRSCSMRNGEGPVGSRVGAAARRHVTSRPSGRVRSPGCTCPYRAGLVEASDVALDVVGCDAPSRQAVPSSDPRTRNAGRPTHDSPASPASKTPISPQVRIHQLGQPVVGAEEVMAAASTRRQAEGCRKAAAAESGVGHGDHEVVDADEHRESVAGRPARYDARASPVSDGYWHRTDRGVRRSGPRHALPAGRSQRARRDAHRRPAHHVQPAFPKGSD